MASEYDFVFLDISNQELKASFPIIPLLVSHSFKVNSKDMVTLDAVIPDHKASTRVSKKGLSLQAGRCRYYQCSCLRY